MKLKVRGLLVSVYNEYLRVGADYHLRSVFSLFDECPRNNNAENMRATRLMNIFI